MTVRHHAGSGSASGSRVSDDNHELSSLDILRVYRSDVFSPNVRQVRHATAAWNLDALPAEYLLEYQARQGKAVFNGVPFIVSFVGERGRRARFLGVFRNAGVKETQDAWSAGFPYGATMPVGRYRYDLKRMPEFQEMENRLIVDWGGSPRIWVQNLAPKPVIEILPRGHVRDFPGFDNVIVSFDELERVVRAPEANRIWHTMLASVAGIYLIASGEDLYVGSAYGEAGILGRWRQYVDTKHGGNKMLKELLVARPDVHRRFTFSILRTLSKSLTRREVIEVESLYKRKLGTRAHGLNPN